MSNLNEIPEVVFEKIQPEQEQTHLYDDPLKTDEEYDVEAGQVDLIQFVSDLLSVQGHPNPTEWANPLDHENTKQQPMSFQRFMVNRALNVYISLLRDENGHPVDSRDALFSMVYSGSMKTWCELISKRVVPHLVKYAK